MHVRTNKLKDGRTSMAFCVNYRDGRRTRTRTIEKIGCIEDFPEYDDPLAHFKEVAKQRTAAEKAEMQNVTIEIHPSQKIDKKTANVKNIGCAVALSQYSALGIEHALRNHMRGTQVKYDINAICRLLVCERIVDPGSKLLAWTNKDRYFFKSNFSDDDVYRALDHLSDAKDTIIKTMNKAISKAGVRDTSAVYYDVTNYYFEINEEDELRRKGVSKEHRPNPIVQMGLLQDNEGIPFAYRKFPGNTQDSQTMIPVLSDFKRDYKLDRVVVVADKGLNCSENIAAIVASGNGFVFSQSIRGTNSDKELKKWVLSNRGYKCKKGFKQKSKQGYKTVYLKETDTATGKKKNEKVDVKYVAFWSEKYAKRARKTREKTLEKARNLIANPGAYTRATSHGAAKYVKGIHYDTETEKICDGLDLVLDEEVIAEEEALDGYYVIVTSETEWDEDRIIQTYHELWKIEESFKITKTELKTQPVFVWTPKHIEAHFLICYIALVILRLLQLRSGVPFRRIREEIASMNCTNVETNWWVAGHRTDESDRLVESVGLEELKLKNLQTKGAKKILAKAAKGKITHMK